MNRLDRDDLLRESIDFLHRYMMKSLQKHAEEYGVTVPQARVIADVLQHEPTSVKQLTQNLKMTQSTVSDIVERLTSKGILMKTPDPDDKRAVKITLTEATRQGIRGGTPEPLNRSVREALNLLEPGEQETVEQGMRLFVSAVKQKMESEGTEHSEYFDILFFPQDKTREK
ncbi:MarR family winged helix-turn-helix transcriptional regulator [Paenibacillus kobensis]|uniref:MarR family winged helix-turn-helix transcriptional regulator n=1 Tax=Paenibacillus kobensis TaxID=59841 RepID=UPI000FD88469|nr:MarR family transcriptional regulator [Paenibacillus kobensis]